ncbi:MAG: hypothetical protein U0638_15310 [Phycisphaerales bacterium]
MRHKPTDRRDVNGRFNRQATWSTVAIVMMAGSSAALAQSAKPAQPPVNTGLSNLPMLPPVPKQASNANANQNHNATPPTHATPAVPPAANPQNDPAQDTQAAGEPGNAPAPGDVKVDDNLIVDLHLNNEDLSKVLEMLSIQSQRNIVASGGIANAKVSANLYGVTFYEALDAILHPNGYGYIDRGNMIYVHTLEELKQIEQASRVRVSKLVTLSYLNAIDAAEFVKPLLSEGGSIKTPGKTKDFSIPGDTPTGADEYALDATLVVYDYEENVAEIEKLLKGLDSKPAQVLVEATIVQTALNENNAFGVDFSLIADMNFADFSGIGGPLKAVDSMITGKGGQLTGGSSVPLQVPADDEGRGLVSTPGNTAGPGTLKLGIVDKDVAVFVKMLDEVSDTTILSNPKILAVNRQPSRVLVGRKVGYLSTTSTDTTTTQTVEFLDTGTQLYFRPFVSLNDSMIRMELKPQVSEAIIRDATDVTGAAVTIPDEITNELVTNVMVKDGQTIVLGGLFRESTKSSRKQVPFLGDIPLIGTAFRGHDDEVQRSEIIFLITPSIVKDELLAKQGKVAKDYVDHARTGAREGLLPWSRDKMTGMKLIEAQKLAAAGDTEKARWKLQQSLSLNANQPDAIGMLKELGGDVNTWSSRSLMEDIVSNEVKTELKTSKFEFDPNHWPTPENHNANHNTNHNSTGAQAEPSTSTTNDSASVTFTPSDAPSSQPTTNENFDSSSNTFTTPNTDSSTQPQTQPQPESQPATEPTPNSDEFVPPTPNNTDSPSETTPATPENSTTDQGVNTSTSSGTSYDSGSFAGTTTAPTTTSTTNTNTTADSTDTSTATATSGQSNTTNNSGTAIAGTQAERQTTPTETTNTTDSASSNDTSTTGTDTTKAAPVSNDTNQAATATPSSTDSTVSNTNTSTNASATNTTSNNTSTTDSAATSTSTNTTSGVTPTPSTTETTAAETSPAQIPPTEATPTNTETATNSSTTTTDSSANKTQASGSSNSSNATENQTNATPTDAAGSATSTSADSAANNTNTTNATDQPQATNSTETKTDSNVQSTDAANQTNSGFEASETSTTGVVHGEKSNLDLLTNAINVQGTDQASQTQNAENSPKSENSSSQNADNNTAAGSASDAQSTSQSQSKATSSAASKSKSKTGKEATTKELKPGKSSAATSKTNAAANSKTAKANTKDSKSAKTKAAQEAKKKKSSWGIFDFLRPSDDDEKTETAVTKGQDDTGPPAEQK